MTLEEAIQHLEETLANEDHRWSCEECKHEHEDLLGFLRELETYRKNGPVGDSEKLFDIIINEPKSKNRNFRLGFYARYYQQLADMATDAYREAMEEEEDSDNNKSSDHGYCTYCKYCCEPSTYEKCANCKNLFPYKPNVTDNWELKVSD